MAGNMNRPGAGENQNPIPMRHLGELPQDTSAEEHGGVESSDAMGHSASATEQEQRSAANQEAPRGGNRERDVRSSGEQGAPRNPETASGPENPQPVHTGPAHPPASKAVGDAGGTDASAGAALSGSRGPSSSAPPDNTVEPKGGVTGAAGGAVQGGTPADTPGSNPVGGTGLGTGGASASEGRTRTGTSSGSASNLSGGQTTGKSK